MEEVKIKVSGCGDCPFRSIDLQFNMYSCDSPKEIHTTKYDIKKYWDKEGKSPKWCPLKTKTLIISYDNI